MLISSVADPLHFGVDPDPDPRIHASDKLIRIRNTVMISKACCHLALFVNR
jgi:hypothetical protein